MTEYFTKRGRYQTMIGDTIEKGFLKKAFKSADLTTAALVTGAVALSYPENPAGAAISGAIMLASDSLITRLMERFFIVNDFYSSIFDRHRDQSKRDKNLVIDTAPEPQQSINSLHKYGVKIKTAKYLYSALAAINGIIIASHFAGAANAPNSVSAAAIFSAIAARNGMSLMRFTKGAHRFNKLAKGEWAIIDEPEGGQKTLEKHLFTLNNRAPKFVASHAYTPATFPIAAND